MTVPEMSKPECRVLFVLSVLGIGGAETWLMALLKYFEQAKKELPVRLCVDICLTGGRRDHFDEEASSFGARLFYPHFCRKNLAFFIREFRRILTNGRYHAIHDHQDYAAGLHFLFGLGRLPPIRIAHIHNPLTHIKSYATSPLRRFTIALGKQLLAYLATHIMGTSRQVVTEYGFDGPIFRNVNRGSAHCGFDVTQFQGDHFKLHNELCNEFSLGEKSKILLFVGRLDSNKDPRLNQKNPEFALETARECINRDPGICLLMAGSGEEIRCQLETRVKTWGLGSKIFLIGPRSDIPRLMVGSDLLLFPSLAEGLGMVTVEAQAAGLRVLASDSTPRECAVVPGIVEFRALDDGPARWADSALRLLKSSQPGSLDCNLIVRHSPFSIDNSAKRLLDLYLGQE
jgi:glycosyltransferase involved in cell wall biosynthesis